MAIHWGSYNNHLRVGIAYTISPSSPSHNDTSVTVTWKFYVGTDGWNWSDNQSLFSDITGEAGQNNAYFNGLTSGSKLILTDSHSYAIDYNSGTVSANCNVNGAYNGANPSKSLTVNLPNRPPGAPSKITGHHAQSIDTNSATIDWTAPANNGASIDRYQVQVDNNSGMGSPTAQNSSIGGTSWNTGNVLSPNTTYYFRVRAHNSAGWGAWSSVANFKTSGGLPTAPGVPNTLGRLSASITVGWTPSNANGGSGLVYTVDCATDSTFTTIVETKSGVSSTNAQFTGLLPGTTYWFRVRATTSLGSSGYSGLHSEATLGALTYNDEGDLVTLMDNFAEAVADKILHLGMFVCRGKTGDVSLPEDTWTNINAGTAVSSRGPDEPTYVGSGTTELTINYEGTYHIEFTIGVPSTGTGGYIASCFINGKDQTDTAGEGGIDLGEQHTASNNRPMKTSGVRRLAVGDVLNFRIYNNTGGAKTVNSIPGSDLTLFYRVTMIGF